MAFLLSMVPDLTGFGAAGLMGAMWLWERRLSRVREEQLGEAHQRIGRDEQRLDALVAALERNTAAFTRCGESQHQLERAISQLAGELRHVRPAV